MATFVTVDHWLNFYGYICYCGSLAKFLRLAYITCFIWCVDKNRISVYYAVFVHILWLLLFSDWRIQRNSAQGKRLSCCKWRDIRIVGFMLMFV